MSTVIFATFLPSAWYKIALSLTEFAERALGVPTILLHGSMLEDFASEDADAGFMDVFSYLQLLKQDPCPIELIATSVARNGCVHDIFSPFFDIVVHAESPLTSPDELEGCVWADHKGVPCIEEHFLYKQALPALSFDKTIDTSSQAQALRYVLDGKADATAIDSRLLDLVLHNSPHMAARLRILATSCYSTCPLLVAATHLSAPLKHKLQEAFLSVHREPLFTQWMYEGSIERFIPATNAHYQDVLTWYEHSGRVPISIPPLKAGAEAYPISKPSQRVTS